MIVTIHQPEHLPWIGFFHKLCRADIVVILDNVQFRTNYFQNRNRILGPNGPIWLTVPVVSKGHMSKTLRAMEIAPQPNWKRKYVKSLEQAYGKHPHFGLLNEGLLPLMDSDWDLLVPLNMAIIRWMLGWLGFDRPVIFASALDVQGSRTDLLAAICKEVGASVYLSGSSGKDYLDETPFREMGIWVTYHDFHHPVYAQRNAPQFISHLSAVDLVANLGEEAKRFILADGHS